MAFEVEILFVLHKKDWNEKRDSALRGDAPKIQLTYITKKSTMQVTYFGKLFPHSRYQRKTKEYEQYEMKKHFCIRLNENRSGFTLSYFSY